MMQTYSLELMEDVKLWLYATKVGAIRASTSTTTKGEHKEEDSKEEGWR